MNSLTSKNIITWLKVIGSVYFGINLLIGIVQLIFILIEGGNILQVFERIFIATIVLIVCLGLARIIEQNIFLINEGKKDNKS